MVSTGVRLRWFTPLAMLTVAACAQPAPITESTPPSAGQVRPVNPADIRRMRGSFPPGYEISDIRGAASPALYWGLKPGWSAEPAHCGALADPAAGGASPPEGLSGSGSGGIIYVVAAAAAAEPDPGTIADCGHWVMDSARTTATVDRTDGPAIDGVPTLGMAAAIRTVVEGGTETDLRAVTVVGYLGEYVAFVTVVTDPGSAQPQLPPELASKLLTEAVATLRG